MRQTGFAALLTLGALGTLSAALYAAAASAPAWLGIPPAAAHIGTFALLFLLYLVALRLALRRPRATAGALALVLGFALLFRLLMLPSPVYLSSDLYRYLWDGQVQWAGVNPYRYAPEAPELAALRDTEIHPRINRPWAVTAYPPAAQWLFALAATVAPWSIPGWRMLLLAIEVGTVWVLLRLLRRLGAPDAAVLAYAWSPLVVFEGVQAGHVDLAVIPLVLLALLWRAEGAPVRGGAALGVAVLLKVYPAILLLAWWRRGDWRLPAAAGATVGLGYLPYALTLGAGALGFLPQYFLDRREDFNLGLRALLTWGLGLGGEAPRRVVFVLLAAALLAVVAWIGLRSGEGAGALWRATALAVGAHLVLAPTSMHPWYVLWVVPFLCVSPSPAWLYFSGAVVLSYAEYLVQPAPLPWWAWLGQYGPLYALLLAAGYRSLTQRVPVRARVGAA